MNVGEVIAKLSEFLPELPVVIFGEAHGSGIWENLRSIIQKQAVLVTERPSDEDYRSALPNEATVSIIELS